MNDTHGIHPRRMGPRGDAHEVPLPTTPADLHTLAESGLLKRVSDAQLLRYSLLVNVIFLAGSMWDKLFLTLAAPGSASSDMAIDAGRVWLHATLCGVALVLMIPKIVVMLIGASERYARLSRQCAAAGAIVFGYALARQLALSEAPGFVILKMIYSRNILEAVAVGLLFAFVINERLKDSLRRTR